MKPLVFIPGWGQSACIWRGQQAHFGRQWPVYALNLPGHGGAADAPAAEWADNISGGLPTETSILIGWSLGGMLAMQIAYQQPEHIAGLVLVSSTPCFCNRTDWQHGCPDAVLRDFEQDVQENSARAISRFFSLMLHGDDLPRPEYSDIAKAAVDRNHPPSTEGLRQGLLLLETLDLRDMLSEIKTPCLILHGERDAVVPVAAGQHLAGNISGAALASFAGCGHAIFLTAGGKFNQRLEGWCRNIT